MVFDVDSYPYERLQDIKACKRGRGGLHTTQQLRYADVICAFDIETSCINPEDKAGPLSIMYVWQFAIEDNVIMGRTWDEFLEMLNKIDLNLPEGFTLVAFVHNLSYEFQYLSGIYAFLPEEVFVIQSRKILRCNMFENRFEFRCSYLLTNMSLEDFTNAYHVEHRKLSGHDFNYNLIRYPWTRLNPSEVQYCVNDVLGLVEGIHALMEAEGDETIYNLPFTSTGYVRREVKRALEPFRRSIHYMQPCVEAYEMMFKAFQGGYAHANRFQSGLLVGEGGPEDILSYDRSSSYGEVIVNCKFPMSEFKKLEPCSLEMVNDLINRWGRAALLELEFNGLRLKDEFCSYPYISASKCEGLTGAELDNGRVMVANHLITTVTDLDFKAIQEIYVYDDLKIRTAYFAKYGYLPDPLRALVIKYYKLKTELKGLPGPENARAYARAKAKGNAIYGMLATVATRAGITYSNVGGEYLIDDSKSLEDRLRAANSKAFSCYAWGVWVAAWARARLFDGIKLAAKRGAYDCFLYSDTDSVKFENDGVTDWAGVWAEYNAGIIEESKRNGAYAHDSKGKVHYMGVYEKETPMQYFKSLGAKKYAYISGGELYLTMSGLPKDVWGKNGELVEYGGGRELVELAGGDRLKAIQQLFNDDDDDPVIFHKAGGKKVVYYDGPPMAREFDGHTVSITRCATVSKNDYELGISGEYKRLLMSINPVTMARIEHMELK